MLGFQMELYSLNSIVNFKMLLFDHREVYLRKSKHVTFVLLHIMFCVKITKYQIIKGPIDFDGKNSAGRMNSTILFLEHSQKSQQFSEFSWILPHCPLSVILLNRADPIKINFAF
jgi:hypothetical protein